MMQGTTKINLAVDRLPQFKCCNSVDAGPEHMGTIHIGSERQAIIHQQYLTNHPYTSVTFSLFYS